MKLISLSLFLLSLLILQFEIVFTAEPEEHHEKDGHRILRQTSKESESSCNLNETGATSSDVSTEKEKHKEGEEEEAEKHKEEQQEEEVEEADTSTATSTTELYLTLKLKYTREFVEIPHFGPYADVINIFHKIILNSPLPEYIRTVQTPLYKPLDVDLKKTVSLYKKSLDKHINAVKKLIEAEVPNLSPEDEQKMIEQHEKIESLNWNYGNEKIVQEADAIFADMHWMSTLPEKTNIMNAPLYHKINNVMQNLKSSVLEYEKELDNIKMFQRCYASTVQHALLRPLCIVPAVQRIDDFAKLESELKLFKSHCQKALRISDGKLPKKNNLFQLVHTVKNVLQKLETPINLYVKPISNLLNKEEKKGYDMVLNLLSTFFQYLKNENAEKKEFLQILQRTKCNTKTVLDTLMADANFVDTIKSCCVQNLQKYTNMLVKEEDLSYISDNLKRVVTYYMKMLPLLKLKADLLFFLHHINKSVITEHLFDQDEKTSVSPTMKSIQRIVKSRQRFLMVTVNETLSYVSDVYNMTNTETQIWNAVSEGMNMHHLARQLQYTMGTACMICKDAYQSSSEAEAAIKYEKTLKKVLLLFWSAQHAIKKHFHS